MKLSDSSCGVSGLSLGLGPRLPRILRTSVRASAMASWGAPLAAKALITFVTKGMKP